MTFIKDSGKMHFYHLLKPLADVPSLAKEDYMDWGKTEDFVPEIGVGECASVMLDVIGTIIEEAQERHDWAKEGLEQAALADSIYNSYSSFVIGAKALLLSDDIKCNTQIGILESFEEHFGNHEFFRLEGGFKAFVLRMKSQQPESEFAETYFKDASAFLERVRLFREIQLKASGSEEKLVISDFYKA